MADVRGAKPSTLRALRSQLAEPGIPHRRGGGHTPGGIMGALGDRHAREVTTREINLWLRKIAATGVSLRTVNVGAAHSGLRQGELVTLRSRDVQFLGRKVVASRTLSADLEASSTKSSCFREVRLPDQAAAALDGLSRHDDFTGPEECAFCNRFGRRLDPSALRRRYDWACDAAGLRPLRFHDLRHSYRSLLGAGDVDLISVKSAMGHRSQIATTERYLHARPTELADRFRRALGGVVVLPHRGRAARG